jgi:UDP-N-acetylmuramate dehydrogenase
MQIRTDFPLKSLNTFGIDVRAQQYVRLDSEGGITDFLSRHPLAENRHLILGGGSNILFVSDYRGTILHPALKGIKVLRKRKEKVLVKAMAGEPWDDLVAFAVSRGWGGIENLSLIPGSVGSSAVQNIGAYGVEVKSVIETVEAISLADQRKVAFSPQECGFGYRASHFKGKWKNQFIITAVIFRLSARPQYDLDYPGVVGAVKKIGPISLENLRRAIIALRHSKLPDPAVLGNAGSFFKNPVVSRSRLKALLDQHPNLPHYPLGDDRYKLAAGWLVDKCGWKGKRVGNAAVYDKQALVLVNRGHASGREILDLSEQIRRSVKRAFRIKLEREVEIIQA